ncbi:acyltransferase family protein [Bradyrhizobium sp. USDA 4486]
MQITQTDRRYAHLDGLRGWASVVVLLNHTFPNFLFQNVHFSSISALLTQPDMGTLATRLAEAAFITFYVFVTNGALAVQVFFVLSGFVLSIGYFSTGKQVNHMGPGTPPLFAFDDSDRSLSPHRIPPCRK